MKFGRAIRLIREALGVDAKILAEKAGISTALLSLVEQGKRKPTADVIARLSAALGVSESSLDRLARDSGPTSKDKIGKRLERVLDDLDWIREQLSNSNDGEPSPSDRQ